MEDSRKEEVLGLFREVYSEDVVAFADKFKDSFGNMLKDRIEKFKNEEILSGINGVEEPVVEPETKPEEPVKKEEEPAIATV